MNEKEQIEEMAEVISAHFQSELDLSNDIYNIAESLYTAGYRKQSDTVKEFANELNAILIEHDTGKFGLLHAKSAMRMVKELAKEYGAEVE